jgi:two-component system, chemotaxis family, protein-glutamate methylesterase/glutaminase
MKYEIVAIGSSWGGFNAVRSILGAMPDDFRVPIVVAQHQHSSDEADLASAFRTRCRLPVEEISDKSQLEEGHVYVSPPDYHTLVDGHTFELSTDVQVHFSRPSIDVLFESVADSFGSAAIGVVLTGANRDGAHGLLRIKENDGFTIVEDPTTAAQPTMPQAAVDVARPHRVASLQEIPHLLVRRTGVSKHEEVTG